MKIPIPGMDFQVKEKRQNEPLSVEQIVKAIYEGSFHGAALLPVTLAYQSILGPACWICSNEEQAMYKRQWESGLVFSVDEFKLIVATQDMEQLKTVIMTKRAFNGEIGRAAGDET
ncbi:hypothetical protein [Propionispora vibrioides]|uniref:Uncharacterized protein n=1 Tax=Propionispora vibrioides TaxID=112903 RepID=A0A1H8Y3J6_9FIRM|nr:hypothetical protein [Propionispora vibrioides]SEP46834.1 hypothetical protein SAMN04490178_14114 [Propionispora vibrioides]